MANNSGNGAVLGLGCFALSIWLGWIGAIITIVVLIIRALLKYVGS